MESDWAEDLSLSSPLFLSLKERALNGMSVLA
jgi:hypothetical protein